MNNNTAYNILRPLIWKIGKSDGEPLWVHQYTAFLLFKKFKNLKVTPYCDERKTNLLELSILLHDIKKSTEWNQMILKGENDKSKIINSYINFLKSKDVDITKEEISRKKRLFNSGRTDHQIQTERDKKYFLQDYIHHIKDKLDFNVTDKDIDIISDIIKHHFINEIDISSATLPGFGNYIKILKFCDRLASLKIVDYNLVDEIRSINLNKKMFDITYFMFSRKLLPSSAILFEIAVQEYKKCGWDILLVLNNGIIFICEGEKNIPDKSCIIELCVEKFIDDNLAIFPIGFGRKSNFTGLAKAYPLRFINIKKDILKGLFNKENIAKRFFKILGELYSLFDKEIQKIRKDLFVVDILLSLVSGTRGIPEAGKKWQKIKNETLPLNDVGKVDKDQSLQYIFDTSKISDIMFVEWIEEKNLKNEKLSELLQDNLLNILIIIAGKLQVSDNYRNRVNRLYNSLFLVEEKKDFKTLVENYFDKYKDYKLNPKKKSGGICELCGLYITQKPGTDFTSGITRFSQIKAEPQTDRKICPLCAYDNTKFQQNISGKHVPVTISLQSRLPLNIPGIQILKTISSIKAGLEKVYELITNDKLIPDLEIPYADEDIDLEVIFDILNETSFSVIFSETESNKKNLMAKYEPLYHLLSLLGYKVSIGTDEQNGLFGEKIIPSKEKYYKSLAVVLLRLIIKRTKKKTKNVFIYTKKLLDSAPSVAISLIDQLKYSKKIEQLYKKFIECLIKANKEFKKLGGEFSMKDLLDDAKFFAENIPIFYWQDFKNVTKHKVTKPVSDFMSETLINRDFQEAIAKFLSSLRKNISSEKKEKLKPFVEEAKIRFKKYYDLKNKSITDFIRAKNALSSAIYTFRRYENLSEVNFDE